MMSSMVSIFINPLKLSSLVILLFKSPIAVLLPHILIHNSFLSSRNAFVASTNKLFLPSSSVKEASFVVNIPRALEIFVLESEDHADSVLNKAPKALFSTLFTLCPS